MAKNRKGGGAKIFLAVLALVGLAIGGYFAWKKWGKKDDAGPTNPGKPSGGGTNNPGFGFTFTNPTDPGKDATFASYNLYLVKKDLKEDPNNNNCIDPTKIVLANSLSSQGAISNAWTSSDGTNNDFIYPDDYKIKSKKIGFKYDKSIVGTPNELEDGETYYIGVQVTNSNNKNSDVVWSENGIIYKACQDANVSASDPGCIPASNAGGTKGEFMY